MTFTPTSELREHLEKKEQDLHIDKKAIDNNEQTWTPEEERKVVRELDIYLIAM